MINRIYTRFLCLPVIWRVYLWCHGAKIHFRITLDPAFSEDYHFWTILHYKGTQYMYHCNYKEAVAYAINHIRERKHV